MSGGRSQAISPPGPEGEGAATGADSPGRCPRATRRPASTCLRPTARSQYGPPGCARLDGEGGAFVASNRGMMMYLAALVVVLSISQAPPAEVHAPLGDVRLARGELPRGSAEEADEDISAGWRDRGPARSRSRRPARHAGRALHRGEDRLPPAGDLKAADMEAILDYWRRPVERLQRQGRGPEETSARLRGLRPRLHRSRVGRSPRRGSPRFGSGEYLFARGCSTCCSPRRPPIGNCPTTSATSSPPSARRHQRTKKFGPLPEPPGTPLGDWGNAIDPDGDCKIDDKGDVAGDLHPQHPPRPERRQDKLNAPRVLARSPATSP